MKDDRVETKVVEEREGQGEVIELVGENGTADPGVNNYAPAHKHT